MTHRCTLAIVVVALMTIAVPASSTPTTPTSYHHARGPQLRFVGCEQQIGVFPMDDEVIVPLLPAGFAPVAFQDSSPAGPTGAPPPPGAEATIQLTATTCSVERAPGSAGRRVELAHAWTYVTPPEQLRDPDAGLGPTPSPYVALLWVATSDEHVARTLRRWGMPARVTELENTLSALAGCPNLPTLPCAPVADVRQGAFLARTPGVTIALDTLVPVVARETTPERLRLFGVADGRLTGTLDFIEEAHTHLMIGAARLTADGTAPFPVPDQRGVALHVEPGYGLVLAPVTSDDARGGTGAA